MRRRSRSREEEEMILSMAAVGGTRRPRDSIQAISYPVFAETGYRSGWVIPLRHEPWRVGGVAGIDAPGGPRTT